MKDERVLIVDGYCLPKITSIISGVIAKEIGPPTLRITTVWRGKKMLVQSSNMKTIYINIKRFKDSNPCPAKFL